MTVMLCRHGRQRWDDVESWPLDVLSERFDALVELLEREYTQLED